TALLQSASMISSVQKHMTVPVEDSTMTTAYLWNPVGEMIAWRSPLDQMFNDGVSRNRTDYRALAARLAVDAYTSDDAIGLVADVPGLKPEQLEVTLESDTLTIRGELPARAENKTYLLHERVSGKFERVLTINTPIDHNKVEAVFEDGVLTLT